MNTMDADYSLGLVAFTLKYGRDFPTATEKEGMDAYNKYKEFYVKYHSDHPAATTDCYAEYLETLGKKGAATVRGHSIRQTYGYTPRLGGLGGTLMDGSERGLGYEGIDLNDEVVCKRKPTLQKLQQALSNKGVILVRAPPMAGKTSLAQLFEHHLLELSEFQSQERRVFRLSLLWMKREAESWDFAERFRWLFGGVSWDEFIEECNSISTVLIVDEVQMIYRPEGEAEALHGGNIFWNTFKSMQQFRRLQIVAFASYGYRGAYDGNAQTGKIMDVSPYRLHQSHIWSLENVRFTEDEFYDYFQRFCKLRLESLKDVDVLGCYVSEVTLLHPGLVAFIMNTIYERFLPQLKEGKEALTFEKIYAYLSSYRFNEFIRNTRAAPRLSDMDSDEIHLVDTVLFRPGGIIVRPEDIPNNGRLIKTSILTPSQSHNMQDNILDFSAPLLRAAYLQDRLGATQRAHIPPKSFQDFIESVFAAMRPETFRMTLSIGCDGRLLERIWQMEFYRSATQILPIDVYISPDVGAVFGTGGYVDFYVNDGRDWAIELLRDGEDLRSHQEKFTENGLYGPILKWAKEYAIIDIRQTKGRPRSPKQNFIYVQCANDFSYVNMTVDGKQWTYIPLCGSGNLYDSMCMNELAKSQQN